MKTFSEEERRDILREAGFVLSGQNISEEFFLEELCKTTQDAEFARVLAEWFNRGTIFSEIEANGYRLSDMQDRFNGADGKPNKRLGVLFSLIPLYLERHEQKFRGIASLIGHTVQVDEEALLGGKDIVHILQDKDGTWYLIGEHHDTAASPEEFYAMFGRYDAWFILAVYPELVPVLFAERPIGTEWVLDPVTGRFIDIPPLPDESKEAAM